MFLRAPSAATCLLLISGCTAIYSFDPAEQTGSCPVTDADVDGADAPADAEVDGSADAEVDGSADADGGCTPGWAVVQGVVEGAGCPWIDDPQLPDILVEEDCRLDTNNCTFSCLDPQPPSCEVAYRVRDVWGDKLCVFVANRIEVLAGVELRVGAPFGVAFVSSTAVVDGLVNASAEGSSQSPGGWPGGGPGEHGGGPGGPGEPVSTFGASPGSDTAAGGGGGGVGSYGGAGGCDGGAGGEPLYSCERTWIIGGGGGGGGGVGAGCQGVDEGRGGAGGGAVYFLSLSALRIGESGAIAADGADGQGSTCAELGGGGGGSGGMVWLESPTLSIAGLATARGGMGGAGAAPDHGGAGGGEGTNDGQPGQCGSDRGGGGGGSAGRIFVRTDSLTFERGGHILPHETQCVSNSFRCTGSGG